MPLRRQAEQGLGTDRNCVAALARGLTVLRCFGAGDRWLAQQEIVARTGLAKPTVSRITHTLLRTGYLRSSRAGKAYSLGAASRTLGFASLAQMDVRGMARPLMQELAQRACGTVDLSVRDGLTMAVVDSYHRNPASFRADVGARIPIATSSVGRAYLLALGPDEQRALVEDLRRADPAGWPRAARALDRAAADHRTAGFSIGTDEFRRDLAVVAVPLAIPEILDPVVFSFTAASFELHGDMLRNEVAPRLLMLAGNVRAALLRE